MTLLSTIFGFTKDRLEPPLTFDMRDNRDAVRHNTNIPITIQPLGRPWVRGTVINISVGGAAIRIHGSNDIKLETWLSALNQRDELILTGLLHVPISCWVVMFDNDVLRVHFDPQETTREQLRGVIVMLTAQ